jgi:hypothetical protein
MTESFNTPTDSARGFDEDRFAVLWTDFLEGQLDAAARAELDALLNRNAHLLTLAVNLYQTHRRLGMMAGNLAADTLAPIGERFVADVMAGLPANGEMLTQSVMAQLDGIKANTEGSRSTGSGQRRSTALLIASGLLAVVLGVAFTLLPRQEVAGPMMHTTPLDASVRFASLARARFVGRETPAEQSIASRGEPYVLSRGLVELCFANGASAILEGPAVFRVCGGDCVAVDAGRCSVHAPEGAEGFRVETPATQVIDRGTRFVVHVDETSSTEVQVIEGAADLIVRTDPKATIYRLESGDVARHDPANRDNAIVASTGMAESVTYRPRLPDRLIRYDASLEYPVPPTGGDALGPGVDTLESIVIQRGGVVRRYDVADLIGVQLLHFHANRNRNNLTLPGGDNVSTELLRLAPARRGLLEEDRLLTTGVINPGGTSHPLTHDAVLTPDAIGAVPTPGLAIAFSQPVLNDAGPDVIFFELQMLTDPPEGDAFHVSPLRFTPDLHTHTVTAYDIDSLSPASQLLARFRLFTFDTLPGSLDELLTLPTNMGNLLPVRAKANAVAIDLSDLGYAEGATCDGLFFQDADDNQTTIDPVFIAGLPPVAPSHSAALETSQ